MQIPLLTRQLVRRIDQAAAQDYGLPTLLLMENAGRAIAECLISLAAPGRVSVWCGKGNNGGDGLAAARHLDAAGWHVRVWLWCPADQLTGDAARQLAIVSRSGPSVFIAADHVGQAKAVQELSESNWVIDALLGIGASGEPRPPLDLAIAALNACQRPVLAVDLPSGLDCDTGQPANNTVRAAVTCTLVGAKLGFENPLAKPFLGQVTVAQIGLPGNLLRKLTSGGFENQ